MNNLRDNLVLQVNRISKSYKGNTVFDEASFSISEGEIVGFIGPNGSGKTTLTKMVLGLADYETGSIQYQGELNYLHQHELFQSIGYLMETPLYNYLNAHDTLKLISFYSGQKISDQQIDEVLDQVDLANDKKKVKAYSFGMMQKLRLAIAFMYPRKLLILDEPTVGLDPLAVEEIIELVGKLAKQQRVTTIISSHQLESLESICQRYLYISDKKIHERESILEKISVLYTINALSKKDIEDLGRQFADLEIVSAHELLIPHKNIGMLISYLVPRGVEVKSIEERTSYDKNVYRKENK